MRARGFKGWLSLDVMVLFKHGALGAYLLWKMGFESHCAVHLPSPFSSHSKAALGVAGLRCVAGSSSPLCLVSEPKTTRGHLQPPRSRCQTHPQQIPRALHSTVDSPTEQPPEGQASILMVIAEVLGVPVAISRGLGPGPQLAGLKAQAHDLLQSPESQQRAVIQHAPL